VAAAVAFFASAWAAASAAPAGLGVGRAAAVAIWFASGCMRSPAEVIV
jgi:hypothetical protein